MRKRKARQLTEAELRVMNALWTKERATVGEVVEAIGGRPQLAYSTVLTMLRILEAKGFVRHQKQGRAFVYEPAIARTEARSGALKHVLARFFENSPELLVANLLESQQIDDNELKRLKRLIADYK